MTHSVDIHVGRTVRHRRWMLGMTQQQLADKIGITIPQIQKYEVGTNRISASLIRHIAAAMEVPVTLFFEGLDGQVPDTNKVRGSFLADKEALELVGTNFAILENRRRWLFDLARYRPMRFGWVILGRLFGGAATAPVSERP
jgi:transcriptional regulator with XRE-family HTH domain